MSSAPGWHTRTIALLAGHVTASFLFFLIAAVQTPELDPPPESVALFVGVTSLGVIATVLMFQHDTLGYPAAMLTAAAAGGILAVVATGTYGEVGPSTNPVGPISYIALSILLFVSAGVAWRRPTDVGASVGESADS